MKNMYKAIIFDLDNTILNYDQCEVDSMKRTCNTHKLFHDDDMIQWNSFWRTFSEHNFRYWMNFVNGGEVKTIGDVLMKSFRDTLNKDDKLHKDLSETYWNYFCNTCFFEDGANHVLSNVQKKFQLGIITNGLSESQRKRLSTGKIYELFQSIVISDEVGVRKPKKEIFEIALKELKVTNTDVLFIGDSLQDDYQGSKNAGIDFCYYNRKKSEISNDIKPKYIINDLIELLNVVEL
jgi:YjjG family noncanonical pyrimidine nucleotidase